MRCDPDTCRDPDLLAAEVRRLQAAMDELRAAADQADVEYRAEIDRLRLTDAEREAVEFVTVRGHVASAEDAATLRGLLSRLSPLSGVGQSPEQEQ